MEKYELKERSRFVDLNKGFEEIKLASVAKVKSGEADQTIVTWSNYPDPPESIKLEDYHGICFPDFDQPAIRLTDYFVQLGVKAHKAMQSFVNELYAAPGNKIEVGKGIKAFAKLANISEEESEAVLKLNVAKGLLVFKKQKGGDFVVLSDVYTTIEDKKRFLSSMVDELEAKSKRVGLIIKHHQTTGNYREQLLISVLKKYIPSKYHVATGFIDGRAKQIDILIYDQLNYIPLFREDDLVVVKPESVRAVIEVKTTLTSDSLWDALDGINQVFKHSTHPLPVFKGVFAFDSDYESTKGVVKRTIDFYNDNSNDYKSTRLFDIVDSICVPNKSIVFTHYVTDKSKFYKGSISPACFSIKNVNELNVEASSFLSDLFAHLDVDKKAKSINLNHFEMLGHEIEYSFDGFIHENWQPDSVFRNEHDFTQAGIMKRLEDVKSWIEGKSTGDDLYEKYFGDM